MFGTGFKLFFCICAFGALISGISMFAGWIISGATVDFSEFGSWYIWGIVPEWILLGIWWGIGFGIPLGVLVAIWVFRTFQDDF